MAIFSILNHLCSLMVYYYLFSVFQFQGNFVDGQSNSKYRDVAQLWVNFSTNTVALAPVFQKVDTAIKQINH